MIEEFIQLALDNIYLIESSPTESLHKSLFKNDSNNIEVDGIVDFLVENEFIESDRYDDIFF